MSDGIYSALSGAIAQERNLSVVANNVANANTVGFKGDRAVFNEILTNVKTPPALSPSLRYANVADVQIDHQVGHLKLTGRQLDVALQGDGFFVVETPQGERYTRSGSFVMDQHGYLRTLGGHRVMQENGPVTQRGREIQIPEQTREIQISPDGTIRVGQDEHVQDEIGKLKIVRFANPREELVKDGLTWFNTANGGVPRPAEATTTVEQGWLEDANINAVSGMNEMIIVTRSFEALVKVIETFRDLDNRTARDVGGRG